MMYTVTIVYMQSATLYFNTCRSKAIGPYTYIGVSYMLCDIIAMYSTFCTSRGKSERSISHFVKSRPLLVLHHLVLMAGYPLLVVGGTSSRPSLPPLLPPLSLSV